MKRSPSHLIRLCGFSLTELAVWMAVIGVLASVCSLPLMGSLPRIRADGAIRGVGTLMEWARLSAIAEGCRYVVAFSGEENRVSVYRDLDSDGPESEERVRTLDLAREYPGIVFGASDGVYRTGSCALVHPKGLHIPYQRVAFLPSGTSDRCGSVYLIPEIDLPTRRDRMRALSILLATGRVQLWWFNQDLPSPCSGQGHWDPIL
jgi:type II secretory pathway pseudopilin PulG